MTDYPNNIPAKLEIIKASEITPKEVRWLWYPYIPFGKVTLLQGDPGDGKSKLMLSLAALLSKGAPLPFADEEEHTEPMTVIYQTTEDDADDTVVPRFNAAGGDGDRLIFIKEDEKSQTFGDDRIREAVEKYNAKLLILDPMSSYIGDTCSMNNANETRAEFNHLIAVAKDTGCAIVIIAHMSYQSEAELEQQLIEQLKNQNYNIVALPDYDALLANFKDQFEAFNAAKLKGKSLSPKEWERVLNYQNRA